jgi:hypothetical protein
MGNHRTENFDGVQSPAMIEEKKELAVISIPFSVSGTADGELFTESFLFTLHAFAAGHELVRHHPADAEEHLSLVGPNPHDHRTAIRAGGRQGFPLDGPARDRHQIKGDGPAHIRPIGRPGGKLESWATARFA